MPFISLYSDSKRGFSFEISLVLRRSNGYDEQVAAQPANAPIVSECTEVGTLMEWFVSNLDRCVLRKE